MSENLPTRQNRIIPADVQFELQPEPSTTVIGVKAPNGGVDLELHEWPKTTQDILEEYSPRKMAELMQGVVRGTLKGGGIHFEPGASPGVSEGITRMNLGDNLLIAGKTGAGKSLLATILLGERNKKALDQDSTAANILGFTSPVSGHYHPAITMPRAAIDEITQAQEAMWVGAGDSVVVIDGKPYRSEDLAFIGTANLPEDAFAEGFTGVDRVHGFEDPAARARFGAILLSTSPSEVAEKIAASVSNDALNRLGSVLNPDSVESSIQERIKDGTMPPLQFRQAVRWAMAAVVDTVPSSSKVKQFLDSVNRSPLVELASGVGDGRRVKSIVNGALYDVINNPAALPENTVADLYRSGSVSTNEHPLSLTETNVRNALPMAISHTTDLTGEGRSLVLEHFGKKSDSEYGRTIVGGLEVEAAKRLAVAAHVNPNGDPDEIVKKAHLGGSVDTVAAIDFVRVAQAATIERQHRN